MLYNTIFRSMFVAYDKLCVVGSVGRADDENKVIRESIPNILPHRRTIIGQEKNHVVVNEARNNDINVVWLKWISNSWEDEDARSVSRGILSTEVIDQFHYTDTRYRKFKLLPFINILRKICPIRFAIYGIYRDTKSLPTAGWLNATLFLLE